MKTISNIIYPAFALTRLRVGLWAVIVLMFAAWPAIAARETHVYGIANFGGSGQCGSSGMTHPVHTATAAAFASWFNALKTVGLWDDVETLNNTAARGSYFTDKSKAAACGCTGDDAHTDKGADEADVIYVHTHGSHSESSPAFSSLSMGNSGYDCSVRTDHNMLWNSDLDIAVIKACQSGDYDTWKNGGYRQQFTNSTSGFRMWNAFHGDSSCGDHVTSYVTWYVQSSTFDGVGENWLDAAYDVDPGDENDDCPVSIVMGNSHSARVNLFENGGWKDIKDTGAKTGSTYFYFRGCNPSSGRKLD
jgi:hypothetical protein